jgi:hypothetical protein
MYLNMRVYGGFIILKRVKYEEKTHEDRKEVRREETRCGKKCVQI